MKNAFLIGVDLGPNLSVAGSLAIILWLITLRKERFWVKVWAFLKFAILVKPLALVATVLPWSCIPRRVRAEVCTRYFPKASKPSGCGSPNIGRLRQRSRVIARLAFFWLLLLIEVTTFHKARAQDPEGPLLPSASFQTTVVQGVVAQYLMNPDGFVDGLLLSNNTIIRFPPHLGQVLTQTVSPQDIVRVEGFFESSGTFHSSSIVDLQSQRSVADYPPSPGHPPPPRPGSLPRRPLSANGMIRVLTQGKGGEINGVVLADGTVVHFAPTVGIQFSALLREGNQFAATGYGTSNEYGRSFEATAIGPSINQLEAIAPDPGPKPRPETGSSLSPSTP